MTQLSIPESGSSHPLVSRIVKLRGRVRLVLGLFGIGAVILAAVGSMFILMLADYLMPMPGWLRLGLLVAWVVAISVLAWRLLIMPLTTRLTDQFLASRVENQNRHLADELISAVHFIHTRAGATNALAAKHIDLAAQRTANIRFEDAVDYRRANKSVALAALTAVIVGILGFANPGMARIALSRWFSAMPMEWPMSTHVTLDWSAYGGQPPRVIPLGEKFTVRAKVDKGGTPRVSLIAYSDKTTFPTQLMTYQKEQSTSSAKIYEATIEPDGGHLTIRVKAGDDTDEPAVTINMAPRPVITDIQAQIHAPAYVKNTQNPDQPLPALAVNLLAQVGRATQGAQVAIRVHATKPFGKNDKGEPDIVLVDPNTSQLMPVAMTRRSISDNEAELAFSAGKTIQARMVMKDTDGFENRSGGTLTLEVVPDGPPSIVITEPRRSVERAPDGFVEITIQGTDDWGFNGLKLRADKFDAKPEDPAAFETDLRWDELAIDNAVGSTTGKTKYVWDLAPLKLDPGMRLSFYAMVHDNYDLDGKQHDWVKSAPLYLQIKSAADIQEAERKALAELADRLRNLKGQQEITRQQTQDIGKIIKDSGNMSADQRAQLANLAQLQTQQAATANALQQRADQIADDLRQNNMKDSDLGKLSQNVSAGMKDVGQQNMPRAASDISKAQEGTPTPANPSGSQTPQESAQSLTSANGQQDQAISTMNDLLQQLAATGDFETMRNLTNKLLNDQNDLMKQTQALAARTSGMRPDELPRNLHNQENKLAADQKDLANKAVDLLDRMDKAAQATSQSDPASSQSMQAASNAGRQTDVPGNQQNASGQLGQNQTSSAGNSQTAAAQGLQQMMDELNKNDLRKLEQLAREIRQLIQDVQKLRDDQDALNKDTVAAAEALKSAIQKLADRQGRLQQNTVIVQKKAQSTQRAGQAATFIGEASDHMVTSATALFSSKKDDSLKPETDAVAALDNALAELKKVQQQVEPDAKNKQLAEFIKKYEEIKKDQATIKESSDKMEAKRLKSDDKELDRQDGFALGKMVNTQGDLIDRVNKLSADDDLSKIEVIVWMNQQVTESMTASRTDMSKQQLGGPLASMQQQALDRLQLIIDALKEEQQKPSEFAGSQGGGGGGGGKPPLVPPVAQLKLLKAMQVVVNNGTKSAADSIKAAATDAEKNEYKDQAQTLGDKQGEIHDRADRLLQQLLGGGRGGRGGPQPPEQPR